MNGTVQELSKDAIRSSVGNKVQHCTGSDQDWQTLREMRASTYRVAQGCDDSTPTFRR